MSNPFDVFFGSSVVRRLRHQPRALARIAERVKPLLMATVHPDRNPTAGPEAAAELSEAFQILTTTTPDELEGFIVDFLARQKGREEELKGTLKELRSSNERLRGSVMEKDGLIARLRAHSFSQLNRLNAWIHSDYGIPSALTPAGAITRAEFHKFRVVVEHFTGKLGRKKFFRGYEFDEKGGVIRVVKSDTLDAASGKIPLKQGLNSSVEVSTARKSRGFLLGTTVKELPHSMKIAEAIQEGLVGPFVAVDRHLLLCWAFKSGITQELRKDSVDGRVVEIIPL